MWLSLTPSPPPPAFEQSDKAGHFVAYGLLMLWFCLLYRSAAARVSYGAGFICMGIALELLQGALGYRTSDPFDMLANALGVLLGWAAAFAGHRILRR